MPTTITLYAVTPGTLSGEHLAETDTQRLHVSALAHLMKKRFEDIVCGDCREANETARVLLVALGERKRRPSDMRHDERACDVHVTRQPLPQYPLDQILLEAEQTSAMSLYQAFERYPPLFGIRERFKQLLIDVANDAHESMIFAARRTGEFDESKNTDILLFGSRIAVGSAVDDPRELPVPRSGDIFVYTLTIGMIGTAELTNTALLRCPA